MASIQKNLHDEDNESEEAKEPLQLESLNLSSSAREELSSLLSIFGDEALSIYKPPHQVTSSSSSEYTRVTFYTTLPFPFESVPLQILISLPPSYPNDRAPSLQLLNKYIGSYATDPSIFGLVLRCYMHEDQRWTEGEACLFDGLEWVRERCAEWYTEREDEMRARKVERGVDDTVPDQEEKWQANDVVDVPERVREAKPPSKVFKVVVSEPIVDRKSTFIGHCVVLKSPDEVPEFLAYLLQDRKIARATHNILAWRCRTPDGVLHQDNDEDGETAAGGRLAHLLQILEVDNVAVVVSRWFGGILLGADRFKHINQAARDTLLLGGFIHDSNLDGKKNRKQGK
ncbi:UPF0029-domain-containing protein [Atractiella rhizophila]|nr:UPF0029-domain-containing protein [Atractiella rhizophila]